MDWNNDGKIDGRDYAHYKSVIDTGSGSSSGSSSSGEGIGAGGWIVIFCVIYLILKVVGSN